MRLSAAESEEKIKDLEERLDKAQKKERYWRAQARRSE
jgi:hypothetical protein